MTRRATWWWYPSFRYWVIVLSLATAILAASVWASTARGDEPKFGGCMLKYPGTCFAPAVSVSLVAMRLKNGDLTPTYDLGIGYGVTFFSDRWHKVGISGTVAVPTLEGGRRAQPALTLSFAEYIRVGAACPLYVRGGFPENGQILFGFGADFGRW